MRKLSEVALEKCSSIITSINEHPFNQELANGSLSIEKFGYYIEQDTLYLRDFSRSLAVIASKAPLKFIKDFISFSMLHDTNSHILRSLIPQLPIAS